MEWCQHCGKYFNLEEYAPVACPHCGKFVLPCSKCTGCDINCEFTACSAFGVRLEDEQLYLANCVKNFKDRAFLRDLGQKAIAQPDIYGRFFSNCMLLSLAKKDIYLQDIRDLTVASKCVTSQLAYKIHMALSNIKQPQDVDIFKAYLSFALMEV